MTILRAPQIRETVNQTHPVSVLNAPSNVVKQSEIWPVPVAIVDASDFVTTTGPPTLDPVVTPPGPPTGPESVVNPPGAAAPNPAAVVTALIAAWAIVIVAFATESILRVFLAVYF